MRLLRVIFVFLIFNSSTAFAGIGISAGAGLPFVSQFGLDIKMSNRFSYYIGYNNLDIDVASASVSLTMPEFTVRYHPFMQALYLGIGVGQESLEASAVDATTGQTVSADVTAITAVAKLGWMWGASDNDGLWFGIDVAYIMPFNADVTITAPGVPITDQDYIDVEDAAEQFGESPYINLTFARLGYLF